MDLPLDPKIFKPSKDFFAVVFFHEQISGIPNFFLIRGF